MFLRHPMTKSETIELVHTDSVGKRIAVRFETLRFYIRTQPAEHTATSSVVTKEVEMASG